MPLKSIRYHLFIALIFQLLVIKAMAADRCEGLFLLGPHQNMALEVALEKAISNKKKPGLSMMDIHLLVERVFNKQEGRRHPINEYWNKNASERSLKVLERELSESLTKEGLIQFFQRHNLLIENSKLTTKLIAINRSRSFNLLSGLWSAVASLNGAPPVFLPEGAFKISTSELNTLLLKGTESAEGRQLLTKYQWRFEANRGYEIFSRYYSRFALAVLIFSIYDKASDEFEKNSSLGTEEAFDLIMKNIQEKFPKVDIKTKEDILFDTILENFHKKYSRSPNAQEFHLICEKVYGPKGCTK